MTAVMIGVDPAKRSHATAVLDGNENEQAALQVRNDNDGYREMLRLAKRWKQRTGPLRVPAPRGVAGRRPWPPTESRLHKLAVGASPMWH